MSSISTPPSKSVVRRSLIEPVDEFPHGFKVFLVVISIPLLFYFLIALTFPTSEKSIFSSLHPKSQSQAAPILPAFPGAVGFGTTTVHGRGGRLIEVTNLNASGAGSFRAAVEASGPRIVVFRVSGRINLGASRLQIKNPYLYIAGQTAPGDGIVITNAPVEIMTHDVVIRFLRFRAGDDVDGFTPSNRDSLVIRPSTIDISGDRPFEVYNIVIDHVSVSWGIDGTFDIGYGVKDVTAQWSIISEGLADSLHTKGEHSTGLLIAENSHNISIHHNLIAHNVSRNPYLKSNTSVDFVNNMIYNCCNYQSKAKTTANVGDPERRGRAIRGNWIGNFYKRGDIEPGWEMYLVPEDVPTGSERWQLYLFDNLGWNRPNESDPQNNIMHANGRPFVTTASTFTRPSLSPHPSRQVPGIVLDSVGAVLPKLDAVDARVIDSARHGTGRIINSPNDVGGYPTLRSTTPPVDNDKDGMSDSWETANGLSPTNAADGSADRNGDGYTNVEEYLNSLVSMSLYNIVGTTPTPTLSQVPTSTPIITPTPVRIVTNLVVNDANSRNSWSVQSNLQLGDVQYGDRNYIITQLSDSLRGSEWIRTAAESKVYTGQELASFSVDTSVDVYIALDDRTTSIPLWLEGWTTSADVMVNNANPSINYRLFKKYFEKDSTVSLGSNGHSTNPTYTVILKEVNPTPTVTLSPTNSPKTADINRDGVVNVFDLGLLSARYGQPITSTSDAVTRACDINQDSTINVFDLGLLIGQYAVSGK